MSFVHRAQFFFDKKEDTKQYLLLHEKVLLLITSRENHCVKIITLVQMLLPKRMCTGVISYNFIHKCEGLVNVGSLTLAFICQHAKTVLSEIR